MESIQIDRSIIGYTMNVVNNTKGSATLNYIYQIST